MNEQQVIESEFDAIIQLIGINPYVLVPQQILDNIFSQAGRSKSPIAVQGSINGKPYLQRLVKYQGKWRLYINTTMLKDSPKRIGERTHVSISFNPAPPTITSPVLFKNALVENPQAKKVFEGLPPYLQKEINRYLTNLKSQASQAVNTERAIAFLLGKGKFIGREKP